MLSFYNAKEHIQAHTQTQVFANLSFFKKAGGQLKYTSTIFTSCGTTKTPSRRVMPRLDYVLNKITFISTIISTKLKTHVLMHANTHLHVCNELEITKITKLQKHAERIVLQSGHSTTKGISVFNLCSLVFTHRHADNNCLQYMKTDRQIRAALVTAVCILRHFQLCARYIIS